MELGAFELLVLLAPVTHFGVAGADARLSCCWGWPVEWSSCCGVPLLLPLSLPLGLYSPMSWWKPSMEGIRKSTSAAVAEETQTSPLSLATTWARSSYNQQGALFSNNSIRIGYCIASIIFVQYKPCLVVILNVALNGIDLDLWLLLLLLLRPVGIVQVPVGHERWSVVHVVVMLLRSGSRCSWQNIVVYDTGSQRCVAAGITAVCQESRRCHAAQFSLRLWKKVMWSITTRWAT